MIVPTVMNALDSEMFPVGEGIVYEMIHNRHKHQHEEYLKSLQSSIYRDEQARQKHQNSRRNDISNESFLFDLCFLIILLYILQLQKRTNYAKTIEHLVAIYDPLIQIFKEKELWLIKEVTQYHSPNVSESDEKNSEHKRKIIMKDLEWHSTTVSIININGF
jgi:hypothetical protein